MFQISCIEGNETETTTISTLIAESVTTLANSVSPPENSPDEVLDDDDENQDKNSGENDNDDDDKNDQSSLESPNLPQENESPLPNNNDQRDQEINEIKNDLTNIQVLVNDLAIALASL